MMLHEPSTFPGTRSIISNSRVDVCRQHRTDLVARSANRLLSCVQET